MTRIRKEELQLEITINGNKAKLELGDLDRRAMKLREEMKGLKKGTEEYAAKSRELAQVKARMDELRNQVGLTSLSMRQLSQRAKELNLIKQHLTPGTAEFKKVDAELQKVNARMRELRTGSQQAGLSLAKMANGFNKYFGMATAFFASILGTVLSLRKLVEQFNEYEKSLSNLSALTGLTGYELDWLSGKAKEMSTGMVEGNIRITSSAKEILDAYTVVGSKMPELLRDQEALNEVTKQAMILAKAGNIDLSVAVDALTNTMNQFRTPASEAANVINIIAAGSKLGAAEIDFIGNSITKFGAAANALNVDITQSVALIEVLGKAGLSAEEAGTGLKTFLLQSAAASEEFNVEAIGLEKTLQNLANANLSAAEMTKLFGMRGYVTAQSLINNLDVYHELINALEGTSIAYEMAAVNSDNNASKLEHARNRAALLRMELGEKLAPALTFSTNSFSYLVKAIMHVIDNWDRYRNIMLITLGILAAHYYRVILSTAVLIKQNLALQAGIGLKIKDAIVMQALIIREAALSGWRVKGTIATKAATAAQRVFNVVVSQFPGYALLAAIMAIVGAIKAYDKYSAQAVEREKEKQRLHGENNKLLADAKSTVENLTESQQTLNTLTVEEKNNLYYRNQEKLRSLRIDLEQMKLNKQKAMQDASSLTLMQKVIASLMGLNGASYIARKSIENMTEAGKEFEEGIQEMERSVKSLDNGLQQLTDIFTAEARANAIVGDSIASLEQKLNLYRIALNNSKIGSADYQRIQKLVSDTQKELNAAMERGESTLEKAANAYDELTKKISEAQKALAGFVAEGNYAAATAMGAAIKNLEAQKLVLDGIIAAKGNVLKFLDNLTDSEENLLQETDAFNKSFLKDWKETFDEVNRIEEERHQERLNRIAREHEYEAKKSQETTEQKKKLDQDWADARESITDSVLQAGSQIATNYINADYDRQMSSLERRRNAELNNENLTAEQRDKIQERYRKQEAKIKEQAWKRQHRADLVQSIINGILAVSRALSAPPGWPWNSPSVYTAGIMGGLQTAAIASQKVPQFAKGRYNIIGKDDNKLYKNVPFMGPAKTGIYNNALVGEKGDELIVDSPTLRNIRVNFPEVLRAIDAARVPQYSSGRMPEVLPPKDNNSAIPDQQTIALLKESVKEFREAVKEFGEIELEAHLVYQKFKAFEKKVDDIEASTQL